MRSSHAISRASRWDISPVMMGYPIGIGRDLMGSDEIMRTWIGQQLSYGLRGVDPRVAGVTPWKIRRYPVENSG